MKNFLIACLLVLFCGSTASAWPKWSFQIPGHPWYKSESQEQIKERLKQRDPNAPAWPRMDAYRVPAPDKYKPRMGVTRPVSAGPEEPQIDLSDMRPIDAAELWLANMPQDQDKCYLTVFGHGERFQKVVKWFVTHTLLKRLRDSAHFHAVDTKSVIFQRRYAKSAKSDAITIRIQTADGAVLFNLSGDAIPETADEFVQKLGNAECLRWRKRHEPAPSPDKDPEPGPLSPPTVVIQPHKPHGEFPVGLLVGGVAAALVVGGSIGLVRSYKKQYAA